MEEAKPTKLMIPVLIVALLIGTLLGVTLAYQFDIYRPESEEQETPLPIFENVTVQGAHSLIQNNTNNSNFVVLDVRTPEEFSDERIQGAVNLDYFNESFSAVLGILDKNKTYLIHCRSGTRSGFALEVMKELEFWEVYNMLGGIVQWKEEGFETLQG